MTATTLCSPPTLGMTATEDLIFNPFSITIYGDPTGETSDLLESIRAHGVLVPLVVSPL